MTDQVDPLAQQVVALAIQAAGGRDEYWAKRVGELIPKIAVMLSPGSPQTRQAANILAAGAPLYVEYVGYSFEESSKRCVVRFKPSRPGQYTDRDGTETARTERTDGAVGKRQRALLDGVAPGSMLMLWKYSDEAHLEKGKGVRTLAHIETRSSATSTPGGVSGEADPPRPPAKPPAEPAPPRVAESQPAVANVATVHEACGGLTAAQIGRIAGMCRRDGIANWRDPTDDELPRVLKNIQAEKDSF